MIATSSHRWHLLNEESDDPDPMIKKTKKVKEVGDFIWKNTRRKNTTGKKNCSTIIKEITIKKYDD